LIGWALGVVARDRLVEVAGIMRRYQWMVGVVRQRPVSMLHPYVVEVYVRTALRCVSRLTRLRHTVRGTTP